MIVSHHPPVQYNRTVSLLGLRICVRCSGALLGMVTGLILSREIFGAGFTMPFWAAALLPIPTAVNFVGYELGRIDSNNLARVLTGFLAGLTLAYFMEMLLVGDYLAAAAILLWVAALQAAAAMVLRRGSRLAPFFHQYEAGYRK